MLILSGLSIFDCGSKMRSAAAFLAIWLYARRPRHRQMDETPATSLRVYSLNPGNDEASVHEHLGIALLWGLGSSFGFLVAPNREVFSSFA